MVDAVARPGCAARCSDQSRLLGLSFSVFGLRDLTLKQGDLFVAALLLARVGVLPRLRLPPERAPVGDVAVDGPDKRGGGDANGRGFGCVHAMTVAFQAGEFPPETG